MFAGNQSAALTRPRSFVDEPGVRIRTSNEQSQAAHIQQPSNMPMAGENGKFQYTFRF